MPEKLRCVWRRSLAVCLGVIVLGTPSSGQEARIKLPRGFQVQIFASGLGGPRFMALDPSGTLLVSIPRQGRVVALADRDGTGKAHEVVTVAEGLDLPHGLAFAAGDLYVAETGRVLRFRYDSRRLKASQPVVVVANLPRGGHWTRTIAFGPDGRLYVSVGSSCNVCREEDRRRAAIFRYNPDGSGERAFASGLRNAVGITFQQTTGMLWATVNERDWRGDDLPPDYITEVKDGAFYGWPNCFVSQRKVILDPEVATGERCREVRLPTLEIQAHSAPLGLTFYTGQQFPREYQGSLFVAYHGSWNRSVPTGYKVVRVVFRDGRPVGVEDFATGWLEGDRSWGRPVDVLVGKDGALYVSDDYAGYIYRITFRP